MIKTALIAALTLGTISVAFADGFDPNLGNRYPQATQVAPVFTSRNVGMNGTIIRNESYFDRASGGYGVGGN
jgi:hypothetical protein